MHSLNLPSTQIPSLVPLNKKLEDTSIQDIIEYLTDDYPSGSIFEFIDSPGFDLSDIIKPVNIYMDYYAHFMEEDADIFECQEYKLVFDINIEGQFFFVFIRASCDNTGFTCQGKGEIYIRKTFEGLWNECMDETSRVLYVKPRSR